MRFSTKIALIFSSIFLAAIAYRAFSVYRTAAGIIETEIRERLEAGAFNAIDKIDRIFFDRYADIKALAADPVVSSRNSTPAQITKRLKQYKDIHKQYVSLSFFDLNRNRIADTIGIDIGKQQPFKPFWKDISEGRDAAAVMAVSETINDVFFHFASIVRDKDGIPFGVVLARVSTKIVDEMVKDVAGIRNYKDTEVDIVDGNGLLIFSNHNKKGVLKETSEDWKFIKTFQLAGQNTGSALNNNPAKRGGEIYAFAREQGYLDFKGNGWTIVVDVPLKAAFAPAVEMRNKIINGFYYAGAVILLVIFYVSRKFSEPLERLNKVAFEIGRGNFDVEVKAASRDEVGRLYESFNAMARDLKKARDEIMGHSQELEAKVSERTSELRESETKYRSLMDNANDAIVLTDIDGRLLEANKMACELLGYTKEEIVSKCFTQLHPPHELDRHISAYASNLMKGGVSVLNVSVLRKDGKEVPVDISANVIGCSGKKMIMGVFRDITERKRFEAELIHARKMEALGQLTGGIAHDFNNFLSVMTNFGHILLKKLGNESPLRFYVEQMLSSAGDASELVQGLLVFSGKHAINARPVNFGEMVENVKKVFSHLAGENISIKSVIENDSLMAMADRVQMEHALINLATNARDAMPQGGLITISVRRVSGFEVAELTGRDTEQEKGFVEISVSDTGTGMDDETKGRIFEPFFTTKGYGKGTGLGLAIVHGIITQHRGFIHLETAPGKGTTFRLYLPLASAACGI